MRTYSPRCSCAAPTHTCQQPIRQQIYAARPPRPVWLFRECYDWHRCIRYYKRTLWHSLTTACIATDANGVSSVSPRPIAHDDGSSKSTSLTTCVQPPVNSFCAILHTVLQSYKISRARVLALGNAKGAAAAYQRSGIVLCRTAWKRSRQ